MAVVDHNQLEEDRWKLLEFLSDHYKGDSGFDGYSLEELLRELGISEKRLNLAASDLEARDYIIKSLENLDLRSGYLRITLEGRDFVTAKRDEPMRKRAEWWKKQKKRIRKAVCWLVVLILSAIILYYVRAALDKFSGPEPITEPPPTSAPSDQVR